MQDFKKLRVWHLARDVALRVINGLPSNAARKVPGLRGQAIRAAMSVSANIVEGAGRSKRSEFHQFLEIALASLNELQGHLILAHDSAVLTEDVALGLCRHIEIERRMLIALMRTLQEHIAEEEEQRRKKQRGQDGNSQTS